MADSALDGESVHPKQWSEIVKEFKDKQVKQQKDEKMIKLTREEIITAIGNQVTVMAEEISNDDNGIYWRHDIAEKMNNKMADIKRLYTYHPSTEFELVKLEPTEDGPNQEFLETCEVEIPEISDVGSECNIPLFGLKKAIKIAEEFQIQEPMEGMSSSLHGEYFRQKLVQKEIDIAHLMNQLSEKNGEIERLNAHVVELGRQHQKDSKEWDTREHNLMKIIHNMTEADKAAEKEMEELTEKDEERCVMIGQLNRIIAEKETKIEYLCESKKGLQTQIGELYEKIYNLTKQIIQNHSPT